MKNIMIEGTSMEEFQRTIEEIIQKYLGQIEPLERSSFELLTRNETASLLKVSKVTLNNWKKHGILTPSSIGNRVYYIKQDVMDAIKPINNK